MNIQMQRPVPQKAPVPSNAAVTVLVLVCATLIGSSAGVLIAERDGSLGEKVTAAAQTIARLASQSVKIDSAATKPADPAPEAPTKVEPAAKASNKAAPSGISALGSIRHSEHADSASVDVELGTTVLVRANKVQNPERIFFDLRDSRRPAGPRDRLKTQKSIQTNGTLVARVRMSEWESGAVRLVLDLKRPCDYEYELAPGPSSHLLVKLRASTLGDISSNR